MTKRKKTTCANKKIGTYVWIMFILKQLSIGKFTFLIIVAFKQIVNKTSTMNNYQGINDIFFSPNHFCLKEKEKS